MSDPVNFKRVFVIASTMLAAMSSVLVLYLDTTSSSMGDEPDAASEVLRQGAEPAYPTRPEPPPAISSYPVLEGPLTPPSLLPIELRPATEPIRETLWPLHLSYQEAKIDPGYYRTWLEAKNPGKHFRAVHAIVTGYCPCPICCGAGAHGITYTGVHTSREPYGIAAPEALINHEIHIPGYMFESEPGKFWKADDTGGAINDSWSNSHVYHFDVRFMSHYWAQRWWGYRTMTVYISQ